MSRLLALLWTLLIVFGVVGSACAISFTEIGDAGQLISDAQVTIGNGPLTEINGEVSQPNDVDLYQIIVDSPSGFSASMDWPNNAVNFVDAQLFLFDSSGLGVAFNDDTAGPDFRPEFPVGSTFGPKSPGIYYLGISAFDNMALSSGGLIFTTSLDEPTGPDGPGASFPLSDWTGASPNVLTKGPYTISLTGTSFASAASVPEPGTFFLLGTGIVGIIGLRRKRMKK